MDSHKLLTNEITHRNLKYLAKNKFILSGNANSRSKSREPSPYDILRTREKVLPALRDEVDEKQSRSDKLYKEAMFRYGIKQDNIKEVQRLKDEQAERASPFKPKIDSKSKKLARAMPGLLERTAQQLEKERVKNIDKRGASYSKENQRANTSLDGVSPGKQSTGKKLKFTREEMDNFYRKNMEWLAHKRHKIAFLQEEKKERERREEDEEAEQTAVFKC